MDNAIAVSRLAKRYGTFTAVDEISFTVEAGEFFGFLGPNGAGKTSTINAIVGLATIDSGAIAIFGHDTVRDWRAARRLVGLAPQEYNFDRYLTIRDVLIYQAGYYGLRGRAVRARADELLERFGLASKANEVFTKLSGGMKRRLTLARALIHEPRVLILDEPTAGVDIELRLELWDMLRELNAAGMTIVLTTHYLEEAQALCRKIGIIERGKIVALDATHALLERYGRSMLVIRLERELVDTIPGLAAYETTFDVPTRTLRVLSVKSPQIAGVLTEIQAAGYTIEHVEFSRSNLQDVFLDLVGR